MRLLVKLSLDLDAGMQTRSASSGIEALDATASWRPDVILLDAVMPGMNGMETLRALQTNPKTAGIPVLFLTGKVSASDIDSFKASGSAGVIAKPFDPQSLASAIRGYVQASSSADTGGTTSLRSMPDFAGRLGQLGADVSHEAAATSAMGSVGGFGASTEALLLDANGNAFALTISEPALGRNGSVPSWTAPLATNGIDLKGAAGHDAPALTVQVAPLSSSAVNEILGMDIGAVLRGDVSRATGGLPDQVAGSHFGPAMADTFSGGAVEPAAVPAQSPETALHYAGPINLSGEWATLIPAKSFMH